MMLAECLLALLSASDCLQGSAPICDFRSAICDPPQTAAVRRLAREVMEFLGSRFAREVAEEGIARLEPRVVRLIERWGDDAAAALRRVGPRAGCDLIERHGSPGARLLAAWGDDGARILASEGDAAARLYARHGDAGVRLMLRHPGIATRLADSLGDDAVRAAAGLGTERAAELAGLSTAIRSTGRVREILAVVERFGDGACAFLWRNKGVVFGAAVLAAFLADPEPYLTGAKKLVVEPAREVASEAARRTDWTFVAMAAVLAVTLLIGVRMIPRLQTRSQI